MKLSKSELLELLVEVIKHDYCLQKLGTILEIIDEYEPTYCSVWKPTESLLVSEEEEEDSESDSSSVAVYLTEGEEES